MSTITIKVNDQIKTISEHKVVTQDGKPTVIKAVDKINYELLDESTGHAPNHIITKRIDKNLHVSFEDNSENPDLIIEGFYDDIDSALIGMAEDGSHYYYIPDSGEVADYVTELEIGDIQGQALGGNPQAAPWWIGATEAEGFDALPWLVGLAGVGVLGAALGSSSSSSSNGSKPPIDTTAPDAPTDLVVSEDGSSVTGKGEPGAKVEITDQNGEVIGEGMVDEDGNFEVDLVPPQVDGEEIEATLTDNAGNTSDSTNTTAPDLTAPDAPTDLVVSEDGSSVTGKGEPDTNVEITDQNGEVIGEGVVDEDGNFEVDLVPPQVDGEEIEATLTDDAGNTSDSTNTTAPDLTAPDLTAPDAPTDLVVSEDGSSVTGKGEPDTNVEITDQNGEVIGEGVVDEDGNFEVDLVPPQVDGEEIEATLTDNAGNTSDATTATAPDLTAPSAPTSIVVGNDDGFLNEEEIDANGNVDVVVGLPDDAKAGDTVIVNGEEQLLTPEDITAKEVTVKVPAPNEGESFDITATIKDVAGNESPALTKNVGVVDTTAPDAPTDLVVSEDGSSVTGKGEPDTKVEITDQNGEVIGEGVVDEDGNFEVDLVPPQVDGEEIEATLTDNAGNTSDATTATAPDLTAPSAPTSIVVGNDDGFLNEEEIDANGNVDVVVGLPDDAKAGDTVIVNGEEQLLTPEDITAKEVTVKVPAPNEGESFDITATIKDVAGNESPALTKNVGVVDTTAPDAPTASFIITDNVANDGSGDVLDPPEVIPAGGVTNDNTPSVNIPAGTLGIDETAQLIVDGEVVEATIVKNTDGTIILTPNIALTDGTHDISYNLKDNAGNESGTGPIVNITVDTTAPGEQEGAAQVAPVVVIPEAEDGINADEIADGIQTQITLPTGTLAGDNIVITVTPKNGDSPIEITHAVTGPEATNGVSEITIPNDANGVTEDGDYSVVANVIDEAGNSSAPSTAVDITVDTVALLTVDKPIAGDDIVNAVEAVEGFNVTGTGTAGDTITLTNESGELIGTVEVGDNGKWSIAVTQADVDDMNQGLETLTITADDPAGNVSSETADITIVPADKLTITSPIAGDNIVNAEEADIGFSVTGTGTVGDTIVLTNEAGIGVGTAVVGANNRWSIAIEPAQIAAMGEGAETLTATSTINSDVASATITIDTVAPDDNTTEIIVDNITADNVINAIEAEGDIAVTGTVSGDYSEGDALTISVNGIDYAGAVDFAGKFSIDVPGTELIADADKIIEVSVTATDAAGNTGTVSTTKDYIVNTDEIIAAADNFVDFQLDATPLRIENENPKDLNETGFTLVGASLGPVLGAGVLADVVNNSVLFKVGENQVRDITVKGISLGVQLGSTMNLSLYKLNESTNEWELQEVKEHWVLAPLLAGKSDPTDFSLDEGQWLFAMSGNEGISVGTGYTLQFLEDTVLDYSQATAVSGSVAGNILADDDTSFSYDELPSGTTVSSITSSTVTQELESASTTIQGQYGTLTISPDGTYEYSVNEDFRGPYGSEESFTYTITSPDGNTASAELTIELNILPVDKQVKIDESLVVDVEPTVILDTTNSEIKDAVGFGVLDLSFGSSSVLDLELLGGKPPLEFTVGDNQMRELTLHGSGGGVDIAKTYSMAVYKLDEDTGQYVQVHLEKNWFNVPFLGGKSDPLTLQFGEGDYKAVLLTAGGLGLLSGNGLYVDRDTIYDYNSPSKFMGQIEGDATPDAGTVILKVGEEPVTSDAPVTYQGQYGQLTIDANGEYSYSVNNNASDPNWQPPYGEVDSFRLVTQDANGKAAVETLNIKISTHTAVNDFNDLQVSEQNLETTEKIIDGVSAATKNISRDFTVADDTLTSATLKIDTTTIGTRLEYSIIDTDTGEVVSTNKGNVSRSLDVTIDNLAPGNYTVEVKRVAGAGHLRINGSKFTTKSFHLDEYMASNVTPVEGLLLENDAGIGNISELKVGSKSVFISDPNQGAKSIDIEGLYGTLTVNKDGSYSYLPNGEAYGIENFTYETISVTGVKETANLEINVGKNIVASIYDDSAVSSAADDSFAMGEGADTLVFNNLGTAAGGNGNNGVDSWTDFDAAQGDTIDITGLLDGNQTASNIGVYLNYEDGVLMVDRNGNSEYEAMLQVTATDLDELLGSIKWEVGTADIANYSIGTLGEDTINIDSNIDGNIYDSSLIGMTEEYDTFNLTGSSQSISLSDILETEMIDISATGANTLSMQSDDTVNSIASNPIYVTDDRDDTVHLQGSDGSNAEQIVIGNDEQTYNAWQVDNSISSQIYIDSDIANVI